jgi:hypothetical protein
MKFADDFALLRCLFTAVSATYFFIELAGVSGTPLRPFVT